MINRTGEMEIFVHVVEQGGFSQAARFCGMTPSAISKLIQRLETRLQARLFNRSTRRLDLTAEGCLFYARALAILADIQDAECQIRAGDHPSGPIRLTTSASYATHRLAPILPDFLGSYPQITLDLVQTDLIVNLLATRTDIAVRAGPLKDSRLIARKLGDAPKTIVAAPRYLERHGIPETIADLEGHTLIGFDYTRSLSGWPLRQDNTTIEVTPGHRVQGNDGEALRHLALCGVGFVRLTTFSVAEDIAAGRLKPVLEAFNPGDTEAFYAVYNGHGGPLPSRIRVFLDFLTTHGRVA